MIPQKLKNLFLLSIPVFVVHGLEEYYTGFYDVDPIFKFYFHHFNAMSVPQATFLVFQIMLWLLLIIIAGTLLTSDTWRLRLMVLPGLVYFFEFHHFWKVLIAGGYYPGVITAMAFPIIAFLFWKELLKVLPRT